MTPPVEVDIVIVNFNTRTFLEKALQSVRAMAVPVEAKAIVVDNASTDGSTDLVREEFPEALLIANEENVGFSTANNQGIASGNAPLVLCMNSDAELTPRALSTLRDFLLADPGCVIAGPRLRNPDGSFQPSCRRFPTWSRNLWMYSGMAARFSDRYRMLQTWLNEEEHAAARSVDMVSGACFLARREYLEAIGGFDENLFFYEEELDLSLPARRRGCSVRYCREAVVVHHGGASVAASAMSEFAERQFFRSKYYVFRKHHGRWYAWCTYASDRTVFTFSLLLNTVRGRGAAPRRLLRSARRAWKESFQSAKDLRRDPGFFR